MENKTTNITMTELLKHMREDSGYSQNTLADKLGIAQTTLSGYETGYSKPNFELVEKIAKICNFEIIVIDKSNAETFKVISKNKK